MKTFVSKISGQKFPQDQRIPIGSIRKGLLDLIKEEHPEIEYSDYISMSELDEYRQKYIEISLKNEIDKVSSLEKEVLEKLKNHELVSENIEADWNQGNTFGQKVADKVASFGGSWKFIIIFCSFILVWILINIFALLLTNFDPYPFILLNLFLSCLAALQAPVIMMSQNRTEEKDRQRSKDNYKVNLKSEIEIQALHEKMDHLMINQQARLFETQNIQVEMLKDVMSEIAELKAELQKVKKNSHKPHSTE